MAFYYNVCMKIWLDTDLGDDIDDTLVLKALLTNKDIEIIRISTVFKNAPLRAKMAKYVVSLTKRNIPIYAGKSIPIKGITPVNPDEIFCQYGKEIGERDKETLKETSSDVASLSMIKALKDNKDAIILAIGPLTNIGKAILLDKENILQNRTLFYMGGDYKRKHTEWNFECDIEAAKIVISSSLNKYAIGLEETEKTKLTSEEEKHLLSLGNDALSDYLKTTIHRFKRSTGWPITPHDFLALYGLEKVNELKWIKADVNFVLQDTKPQHCFLEVKEGNQLNYLSSFDRADFVKYLFDSLSK